MEPSAKREREAANNRDTALRIVFGPAGQRFMSLRERLMQEPTCKDFALVDESQGYTPRDVKFVEQTKGWRATPATAARLAAALAAPANLDAGANDCFAAVRAARAWKGVLIAVAALAGSVGVLFAAGIPDALMRCLSRATADGDNERAILCFEVIAALLSYDENDHTTEYTDRLVSNLKQVGSGDDQMARIADAKARATHLPIRSEWSESHTSNLAVIDDQRARLISTNREVSDALMDAGLIDAIGAVAATREPSDGKLRAASFLALEHVVWLSEHALPRVTAPLVTNLLELIAVSAPSKTCEEIDALATIVSSNFKKFELTWPEGSPKFSCAAGALDPLVSPRGLSLLTGVIREGFVLEVGGMFDHLALETDLEDANSATWPYARSIAASQTLLEALYEIIALDDAGAQSYTALTKSATTNSDGSTSMHFAIRSHSGYAGTTWTTFADPRVAALEVVKRVVEYGGFPDGARLRPVIPLLMSLLMRTLGPDTELLAQFGPDKFECREHAFLLIQRLSGSKYGLSREIVEAGGPAAILDVIERNRQPGSTAVPELIAKVQKSAWYALMSLAAAGQLEPVRLAIAASNIVQPDAPARPPASAVFSHRRPRVPSGSVGGPRIGHKRLIGRNRDIRDRPPDCTSLVRGHHA